MIEAKKVYLSKYFLRIAWAISANSLYTLPIIVAYYQTKGITTGDFFLLQSMFTMLVFLLEIPTGYISDIINRKKIILVSVITWILANFTIYKAENFASLAFAQLLFALASSFISGTIQAYLYDLLSQSKKTHRDTKEQGKLFAIGLSIAGLTTLIGGYAYQIDIHLPIILTICSSLVAIPLILMLPSLDKYKRKLPKNNNFAKDIKSIIKSIATKHKETKWIILYSATNFACTMIIFWILQPFAKKWGIEHHVIGVMIFLNMSLKSFAALYANKFCSMIGTRNTLFSLTPLSILAAILLIAVDYCHYNLEYILISLVIIIISIIHGAGKPITFALINQRVKSNERATSISIYNMVQKLISATALFSTKYIIDYVGLSNSVYLVLGLSLTTFISVYKLKDVVLDLNYNKSLPQQLETSE